MPERTKKAPPLKMDVLWQPKISIPEELRNRAAKMAQRKNLIPPEHMRRSQTNVGIARLIEILINDEEKREQERAENA